MQKIFIIFYILLFYLTSSVGWSLSLNDLFEMKGIYYNKLTEVPFTGKIEGKTKGSFKNGKPEGFWVSYHLNGQLRDKGQYKNGLKEGSWVSYFGNGQLRSTRNYKNGIMINN